MMIKLTKEEKEILFRYSDEITSDYEDLLYEMETVEWNYDVALIVIASSMAKEKKEETCSDTYDLLQLAKKRMKVQHQMVPLKYFF
jgi:tartrate dehydratase alpha subunit/fumarate hydratase class I-like protein